MVVIISRYVLIECFQGNLFYKSSNSPGSGTNASKSIRAMLKWQLELLPKQLLTHARDRLHPQTFDQTSSYQKLRIGSAEEGYAHIWPVLPLLPAKVLPSQERVAAQLLDKARGWATVTSTYKGPIPCQRGKIRSPGRYPTAALLPLQV